jgi:competence protein ComEC
MHPLRAAAFTLVTASLLTACSAIRAQQGSLRATMIDVEGGQSTLFVTPAGESLLIDTGWPGNNGRDADRIVAAAHAMGVTKLDYVLITHFHSDHIGGVPQLVARMPVGTFIDHGPSRELNTPIQQEIYANYQKVLATGHYGHIVPKPGDVLPIKGIHVQVISADGAVIQQPLPGAGQPNPNCPAQPLPPDQTENSHSLGVEITFGRTRILDLGDLTKDKEQALMCPINRLGHVDILIVSHHGWNQSSSPALIDAIHARVALMDNGETKGGSIEPLDTIRHAPGLEDLYQLHYSKEGGDTHNAPAPFLANLPGFDHAYTLSFAVHSDGSFQVMNSRAGAVKSYAAPSPSSR